jgi:tRNA(Ile)-lysidine synthase
MKYVALSGGADSVCLLLKLLEQGEQVTALHCNFHLRDEESNRDEQFCRALCERLNMQIKVKDFDTREYADTYHISIEMAARELRYNWFAEETDIIYVAHHRDDQAETVLMNIIRGTGIKGLTGISPESVLHLTSRSEDAPKSILVKRPLLSYTKEQILQYLEDCHQDYVTDSTNLEREALRNKIRLDLIPQMERLNPKVKEHICQLAENANEELLASETAATYHLLSPLGFKRNQIKEIAAYKGSETRIWISDTHRLVKSKGIITYEQKHIVRKEPFRIDADKINGPLLYRRVRPGDRFRPFGMKKGTKLVNDYLAERGVNLLEREKTIVAHTPEGQIVWVVDHEIDDRFRVDESTRNVLTLTFS